MNQRPEWRSLVFGGLLPLVAYTVIENEYGTRWGLVAGLAFGLGEILWEWTRHRRVNRLTWISNGLLLALGGLSLLSEDGLWFKLQPAILEAVFAVALIGSLWRGGNLLSSLMNASGQPPPPALQPFLRGLCFRTGLFFALQAALATHAAFFWSTEAWVLLKGVGVTVSFVIYLGIELIFLRQRLRPR